MRLELVVADPQPLFRVAVRSVVERDGLYAVREAASLQELEAQLDQRPADLVLVDLHLPRDGGVAAVGRLRELRGPKAIAWGLDPARDQVLGAVRAGAIGVLHKRISAEGLLRALRGIDRGEAPLCRGLARAMIEAVQSADELGLLRERAASLSAREREVLGFLSDGAPNRQVAHALSISEFTVKRHVQNILHKLDVSSRGAAAAVYRSLLEHEPAARLQRVS